MIVVSALIVIGLVHSYVPGLVTRRSTMTMRKGRKSLKKTISGGLGGKVSGVQPMGGEATVSKKTNWVPVAGISSISELETEENKVQLIETKAAPLMNAQVNPNGAVSVVKYGGSTFCFSSSCPSCKIPLSKSKVFPPNEETGSSPRISCDFCSATYNIRTGEKVSDAGGTGGMFGGIVKGLMNSKPSEPLPTYDLGEKNGKVLINLP